MTTTPDLTHTLATTTNESGEVHPMSAVDRILERLSRRFDMCHRRFEKTGDEAWLRAANETGRLYLRMKATLARMGGAR